MDLKKVGLYAVLGIGALLLIRVVVSTVLAVVGFLWTALTTAVTIAVLLGIAYGVYKAISWLRDGDSGMDVGADALSDGTARSADAADSVDPVDRVTQQYVEGDLSERELEDRLDATLDETGRDEIDREIERSRSE